MVVDGVPPDAHWRFFDEMPWYAIPVANLCSDVNVEAWGAITVVFLLLKFFAVSAITNATVAALIVTVATLTALVWFHVFVLVGARSHRALYAQVPFSKFLQTFWVGAIVCPVGVYLVRAADTPIAEITPSGRLRGVETRPRGMRGRAVPAQGSRSHTPGARGRIQHPRRIGTQSPAATMAEWLAFFRPSIDPRRAGGRLKGDVFLSRRPLGRDHTRARRAARRAPDSRPGGSRTRSSRASGSLYFRASSRTPPRVFGSRSSFVRSIARATAARRVGRCSRPTTTVT